MLLARNRCNDDRFLPSRYGGKGEGHLARSRLNVVGERERVVEDDVHEFEREDAARGTISPVVELRQYSGTYESVPLPLNVTVIWPCDCTLDGVSRVRAATRG